MEQNKKQRNIKIIAEIHPQHMGSIKEIERMILQCKISGADYVKVQLYNSRKLSNNSEREFLELKKNEFLNISKFAEKTGIDLFASVFDEERVDWCEEAGVKLYKIASRTVEDKGLCEKIISKNKPVIISLGMYDYKKKDLPYKSKKILIENTLMNQTCAKYIIPAVANQGSSTPLFAVPPIIGGNTRIPTGNPVRIIPHAPAFIG